MSAGAHPSALREAHRLRRAAWTWPRDQLLGPVDGILYVSRYGPEWEGFLDSRPVYARIEADRGFTFAMPAC